MQDAALRVTLWDASKSKQIVFKGEVSFIRHTQLMYIVTVTMSSMALSYINYNIIILYPHNYNIIILYPHNSLGLTSSIGYGYRGFDWKANVVHYVQGRPQSPTFAEASSLQAKASISSSLQESHTLGTSCVQQPQTASTQDIQFNLHRIVRLESVTISKC